MTPNATLSDEFKFKTFFLKHHATLVLYAYRFTDNQQAAEDIATDAFVAVWKRQNSETKIQNLKSYLYRATRNACYNELKRRSGEDKRYKKLTVPEFDATALENMIYAQTMGKIYETMDKMPKRMREVFILHYIHGKKLPEIAEELGLSINTIKTHKQRAIELLQKSFRGMPLVVIIEMLRQMETHVL
jgi:RNA polymerase sigma-70 factor (family 1)